MSLVRTDFWLVVVAVVALSDHLVEVALAPGLGDSLAMPLCPWSGAAQLQFQSLAELRCPQSRHCRMVFPRLLAPLLAELCRRSGMVKKSLSLDCCPENLIPLLTGLRCR